MASLLGLLAAASCGLFAGAALYINLVEHPARMSGGVDAALRQFEPSYRRAAVMQASLAILGGAAGILAWAVGHGLGYLVGALVLLAVVPFTLLVVFPVNQRLHALHRAGQVGDGSELLRRWNRLHAVRTALGLVAFGIMLFALRR
jgi:uncharacterized membrane protein